MTKEENGNKPAYPTENWSAIGLTKREYFAGLAMQQMCHFDLGQNYEIAPEIAKRAVIMADALLNELIKN